MKRKTMISGLAIFLISSMTFAGYPAKPKDITGEIQKINNDFSKYIVTGNIHAVAMLYTKDAKVFPANSDVVEGRDAIEKFLTPFRNFGIKKYVLKTVEAKRYGNIAIEEGRYKMYLAGDQLADQGKYMVIWKKVDGQWKIYKDIFNTSVPKPQPESK